MSRTRSERPAVSLHAANQRGDDPSRPCVVATRGPAVESASPAERTEPLLDHEPGRFERRWP